MSTKKPQFKIYKTLRQRHLTKSKWQHLTTSKRKMGMAIDIMCGRNELYVCHKTYLHPATTWRLCKQNAVNRPHLATLKCRIGNHFDIVRGMKE